MHASGTLVLISALTLQPHALTADCWSMPYIIHVAVAAISLLLYVLLAALFQVRGRWDRATAASHLVHGLLLCSCGLRDAAP